jgi:hypothetical protein
MLFEELLHSRYFGDVLELVLELLPVQRSLASSIPLKIFEMVGHLLDIHLLSSNLSSVVKIETCLFESLWTI